jgi:RNA polymerase sigma factor (sigma-70 family)
MDAFLGSAADNASDMQLAQRSLQGSRQALEELVRRHQTFIYNLALRLVLIPEDAEDITQDVLIKVITRLSSFQGQSGFRTWLYRIVMNHFLDMKKRGIEDLVSNFSQLTNDGERLLNVVVSDDDGLSEEQIEETKVRCTAGMLMCLTREQRLLYLLGDVFGVSHTVGAELLDLTPDNYRQQLVRARKDLYNFINQKCGLVNSANSCRCNKKTKVWIEAGLVEKDALLFTSRYQQSIGEYVDEHINNGSLLVRDIYTDLYRSHPLLKSQTADVVMQRVLGNQELMRLLRLEAV